MKDVGLKPVANEFKFYLIQQGKQMISESDASLQGKDQSIKNVLNNTQIVEKLLEMHVLYREMVETCFEKDPLFIR